MIEYKNLELICQKYEYMFNALQYRMKVDQELKTSKELLLQEYSIL